MRKPAALFLILLIKSGNEEDPFLQLHFEHEKTKLYVFCGPPFDLGTR